MAIIIDGNGRVYGLGDPVTEGDASRRKFVHDVMVTPREIITYTSSGTFYKADYPGMAAIRARCVGGGGGGGGSSTNNAGGPGGGAGSYSESVILASELASAHSAVVGAGGSGSSAIGANGGTGGQSSFGAFVTAPGGSGANLTATGWGGFGGTEGTGNFAIRGGSGQSTGDPALFSTAGIYPGGMGGNSFFGGGGRGSSARAANVNGDDGRDKAGGGGGGAFCRNATVTGGSGGHGVVIVEIYGSVGVITPLDPQTFGFNRLMQVNQSEYDGLDPDDDTVYLVT